MAPPVGEFRYIVTYYIHSIFICNEISLTCTVVLLFLPLSLSLSERPTAAPPPALFG